VVARTSAGGARDRRSQKMGINSSSHIRRWGARAALVLALSLSALAAQAQQRFPSPEAAADALVDALATSDREAYDAILGAGWRRFIPLDGFDAEDKTRFLEAWARAHAVARDSDTVAHLTVGADRWVLPIPIAKQGESWRFDTRAGAEEIRMRRIGRNELSAMQAALAYCDAQRDYALADHDGDGVLEYAQRLISTPGKQDGLYWAALPGEAESPLGPLFGDDKPSNGYYGYRFRILKAQGPHASGGAYDYRIGRRMAAGFALVAWPAKYGDTGVMSFIVSHDGQLYQKDLGPRSGAAAQALKRFDPDSSWEKVSP